jgi:TolA-binding protein
LRKNIDYLNTKLENVYREHDSLSKNNDYGRMEKDQLKEEIQKMRVALQRSEEEREYQKNQYSAQLQACKSEIEELRSSHSALQRNLQNMKEEKDEI